MDVGLVGIAGIALVSLLLGGMLFDVLWRRRMAQAQSLWETERRETKAAHDQAMDRTWCEMSRQSRLAIAQRSRLCHRILELERQLPSVTAPGNIDIEAELADAADDLSGLVASNFERSSMVLERERVAA